MWLGRPDATAMWVQTATYMHRVCVSDNPATRRQRMMNEPVPLTDCDADNKVADADLALQALGGDHVAFARART